MIRRMTASPPDWSRVEHVLLDMDGTVLDLAFDNFLWRRAVPRRYAERMGISLAEAEAELAPKFAAVAHTLAWYDLDHWSRLTGIDLSAMHVEMREHIRVLDNTLGFLDAVRQSGRRLWLATNAHPGSWRPKLEQAGLSDVFEVIVSSHDAQAPKEEIAFWEYYRRRHPFDPQRSFFADDSLPVLQSAQRFGIGQIVAMCAPDSGEPRRQVDGFCNVARLDELLPLD